MSADILAAIDGTLADWEESADSVRWQSSPFPPLSPVHAAMARNLCARTGMDGYAAWLAVADVAEWGKASPFWDLRNQAAGDETARVTATITVDVDGALRALQMFSDAMTGLVAACGESAKNMGKLAHALAHHRRVSRCPACNPGGNPAKLPIDGHEYRRRQKARGRRKR